MDEFTDYDMVDEAEDMITMALNELNRALATLMCIKREPLRSEMDTPIELLKGTIIIVDQVQQLVDYSSDVGETD